MALSSLFNYSILVTVSNNHSTNPFSEGHSRRVISIIGDGSFQLTAQEVATMIRQRVKVLIFLMNNR